MWSPAAKVSGCGEEFWQNLGRTYSTDITTESRSFAIFRHRRSYERIPTSTNRVVSLGYFYKWPVGGAEVGLTSTAEGPSSTVEVHNPSLQLPPPQRLKDPGGGATERGVRHVHGVTGVGLDLLHPGHNPVQQVDPVAHAQRMSSIALNTRMRHVCFHTTTVKKRKKRKRKTGTRSLISSIRISQRTKNRLLRVWTTGPR